MSPSMPWREAGFRALVAAARVVGVLRPVRLSETGLAPDLQLALHLQSIQSLALLGPSLQRDAPWSLHWATVPASAERVEGGLEEDQVRRKEAPMQVLQRPILGLAAAVQAARGDQR